MKKQRQPGKPGPVRKVQAPAPESGVPESGAPESAQPAASGGPAFWALAATVAGVALAIAPSLRYFDITPKLVALVCGACVVWLLLAWPWQAGTGTRPGVPWVPARPGFRHGAHRARRRPSVASAPDGLGSGALRPAGLFFLLLAGLATVAILATIFSRDPVLSLAGAEWRRLGLPAWLACLALAAAVPVAAAGAGRRRLVTTIALAALLAALYSFAQYLGWDPWIDPALYRVGEGEWQIVRPPATLGYVSYSAAFLLIGMFSAVGLAFSAPSARARWAWSTAAGILALALLITGARGAWLGAVAGGVLLLPRLPHRRALLVGGLALAVVAGAFVVSPAGRPIRSRIRWFLEDPGGGGRIALWRDSLRLVAAHPLLGTGPDTFGMAFPPFESLQLAQRFPDRFVESPHNVFLDYLTAAGIPALLLMAGLLVLAAWNFFSATRGKRAASETAAANEHDRPATLLDAALLSALVASVVAAQFIADTIPTRLALMVLAALSVRVGPGAARSAARPLRLVIAVVAAAGLAVSLWFGARMVRADRGAWQATQAATRGDVDTMIRSGRAAMEAFPWSGGYAFSHSRLLGQLAENKSLAPEQRRVLLEAAEAAARAAAEHFDRRHVALTHLASLYVFQQKYREAEEALNEAARLAPAWYRPRWLLAALMWEQGRRGEAAEQAAAALERGAREHPEIAARCVEIRRLAR